MMSAGLIGSVGLGFAKDKFASEALQTADSAVYAEYKAVDAEGKDVENSFFVFKGGALDGKKMGAIKEKLDGGGELTEAEAAAQAASIEGDRKTLRADAFIPVIMAVIYLLLLLYFKMKGGYRPVKIEDA